MASDAERAAMQRALRLAATPGVPRGPNPRVGAVVLDTAGRVVGEGFHRGAGSSHAEVDALSDAGDAARGATVVVTLEPCHHQGRTGPCTQALLDAGVARVVFGQADVNPVARGGGDALRAAGVSVEGGVHREEAARLNPIWSFALQHGRPLVTLKTASTLDGRTAAADGTSRWISGPEARAQVHRLRAQVDAVVIGTGTALVDDPHLTARDAHGALLPHQPLRVVLGDRALPASARVLDDAAPTLLAPGHDVDALLTSLVERDVQHVLLEGGPTVTAAFLRGGLVDRMVGYLAPALLGDGPSLVGDLGVTTIGDALRLELDEVHRVGPDIRWTALLHPDAPPFEGDE
jgi:diaminohydroxyphosphoribosylaminopyrimidine deaminase / 5-amino-6-(5-phosphoribosylamino)uracil reductase